MKKWNSVKSKVTKWLSKDSNVYFTPCRHLLVHTIYNRTIQGWKERVEAAGAEATVAAHWFQIWSPLATTKVTLSFGTFETNSFMKSSWQAFPVVICFWQQYSDGVLLLLLYMLLEISIAQRFVTFVWHSSKCRESSGFSSWVRIANPGVMTSIPINKNSPKEMFLPKLPMFFLQQYILLLWQRVVGCK